MYFIYDSKVLCVHVYANNEDNSKVITHWEPRDVRVFLIWLQGRWGINVKVCEYIKHNTLLTQRSIQCVYVITYGKLNVVLFS